MVLVVYPLFLLQRENALYTVTKLAHPFGRFDMDGDLSAIFKVSENVKNKELFLMEVVSFVLYAACCIAVLVK
jgi:hypothetical protein